MAEKQQTGKTLFVGNLPFDTTNEQLAGAYEEYGPIKSCFVVKDTSGQRCRGFGYVVYSVREDSEKAQKAVTKIGGRRVNAVFAKPKDRHRNRKKKNASEGDETTTATEESVAEPEKQVPAVLSSPEKAPEKTDDNSPKKSKKRKKAAQIDDSHKTLVVTGIGAKCKTDELTSGCKELVEVTFPAPGRDTPTALIKFATKDAAHRALGKICKKGNKTQPIKATFMYKEAWTPKPKPAADVKPTVKPKAGANAAKWCKVIVRNLSFKCTEKELEKAAHKFGPTTEVKIPLKPDGKMIGYGFIQFTNLKDAQKAIKKMNAKPILGRPVAVDWALPRDKYKEAIGEKPIKEEKEGEESDSDEEDIPDDKTQKDKKSKSKKAQKEEDSDDESEDEADDESDDDEEMDAEESDESESENTKLQKEDSEDEEYNDPDAHFENDDSDEDDDDDDDDDSDEGFSEGSSDEEQPKKKQRTNKPPPNDVGEGKTLFIRNVSFDTLNDDLEEFMEDHGEIKSCRIVIDQQTEHSKGVAFVQFVNKEDAEKCLKLSEDEQAQPGGLVLDGRRLKVSLAISREEAGKLKVVPDKEKEQKDKRNLWLLREGLIRPGTQAAQGLSKADLLKREQVERLKRQKLKNPDVFVSPTRVCVRNIPTNVKDVQLRKMFLKAAQDKSAVVKECRVMRDLDRVNASGLGKSRGYAFVEFDKHEHALAALRHTNNNPELFGDKRRLIVEFSLESRSALRTKQERLERAQSKQEMMRRNAGGKKGDRRALARKKITVGSVQAPPEGLDTKKIPRGMPSHMGAKIRHKPRGAPKPPKKPADKISRATAQVNKQKRIAENTLQEPSKKKRRAAAHKTDDIDKLVAKYKTKFNQASMKKKSQKWFET